MNKYLLVHQINTGQLQNIPTTVKDNWNQVVFVGVTTELSHY